MEAGLRNMNTYQTSEIIRNVKKSCFLTVEELKQLRKNWILATSSTKLENGIEEVFDIFDLSYFGEYPQYYGVTYIKDSHNQEINQILSVKKGKVMKLHEKIESIVFN